MNTRFDTGSVLRYEFTHGHRPRGAGYWMFDVLWDDGVEQTVTEPVSHMGTYAAARAVAMKVARERSPRWAVNAWVSVCT